MQMLPSSKSVKVKPQLLTLFIDSHGFCDYLMCFFYLLQASRKIAPLKWRRVLQNTGLVVKDVVCLPGGHLDR